MSETVDVEATGTRGMLPSTWQGRTLKVRHQDDPSPGSGKVREVGGTLLGACGLGPVLLIRGDRTVIPWERLLAVTLDGP